MSRIHLIVVASQGKRTLLCGRLVFHELPGRNRFCSLLFTFTNWYLSCFVEQECELVAKHAFFCCEAYGFEELSLLESAHKSDGTVGGHLSTRLHEDVLVLRCTFVLYE